MNNYCGYYSVIQFCPNRTLMEAASIGVLLFCPDLKFVGVRTTKNNRRIEKTFGKRVGDENFLQSYKNSLEHHCKKTFPCGASFEEMQSYLRRSFVNDIYFTDIRTTLITAPEADLNSLFTRIFGAEADQPKRESTHYRPQKKLLNELRSRRSDILEKIAIPSSVKIPEHGHTIFPALVFLNECVNIVVPRTVKKSNAAEQAGFGIVTGELLAKHEPEWGRSKMVILADAHPADNSNDFFNPYRDLLMNHGVGYYDKEEILIQHILDCARDLPAQLACHAASRQNESLFV